MTFCKPSLCTGRKSGEISPPPRSNARILFCSMNALNWFCSMRALILLLELSSFLLSSTRWFVDTSSSLKVSSTVLYFDYGFSAQSRLVCWACSFLQLFLELLLVLLAIFDILSVSRLVRSIDRVWIGLGSGIEGLMFPCRSIIFWFTVTLGGDCLKACIVAGIPLYWFPSYSLTEFIRVYVFSWPRKTVCGSIWASFSELTSIIISFFTRMEIFPWLFVLLSYFSTKGYS